MNALVLSNYMLSIQIMKNIALCFSNSNNFTKTFQLDLASLKQSELLLAFHNEQSTQVSFLVTQHKTEILDTATEYPEVIRLSFNDEFQSMLQVCVFVPFLHKETPRPRNVAKILSTNEKEREVDLLIAKVLVLRQRLVASQ